MAAAGERVAVVLGGGGARGAYEAGALSVLLPELERRGQRPTLFVGTSAGALNTALLAATAHLPAAEVAELATAIWSELRYGQVLEPLVSPGSIGRVLGYLGEALGVPRAHLWSVLDPSPLTITLPERVDFAQLRRNVADGVVHAAAVVATSSRTARSVVFHQGGEPSTPRDDRRGIDYLAVKLRADHVLASAAIPVLFPAVEIAGEWYSDGGTRLNTPVKPALELGADRIVAVAVNALAPADFDGRPDALVSGGGVLQALLADQLLHDVRTLEMVNAMVADAGRPLAGRRAIPHVLVTPERPDTIGTVARDVFERHYGALRDAVHDPDLVAVGRALAGDSDAAHGEILSYLFFAPEFARALLALGRAHAETALERDGFWRM